jgi:hypothetical protein
MLIGARSGSPRAGWGSIDDGGSSGSSSGSSTSRSATVSVPVAPAAPPAYLEPALNKVTTPTVDAARDARKKALLDQLQARMSQDLVVDRNNPVIRSQADAYSANAERARRQYLSNIAERSSPYSTGNMRNEERMTAERLGQNVGGFEAELMGRELAARRQEIQAALDSMGNLLTEAERQQLQRELAAADNALQRYGIENQNSQFYAGLSQSDKHFYDQLAQSGRLADLENDYRNRSLAQSQGQWLDKLGFDTADRQAYWDAVRRGIL